MSARRRVQRSQEREGMPSMRQTSLSDLRVAVDVQHLYKPGQPNDHGAKFRLGDGTSVTEAQGTLIYAHALTDWLRWRGATVLANDPVRGVFVGTYGQRNRAAWSWGAHLYLACHLNAGGGSYALCEYMKGRPGETVAKEILLCLTSGFPEITTGRILELNPGQRGEVCVRGCDTLAPALILEPFFGDTPAHQPLLSVLELALLGRTIGRGISEWWLDLRLAKLAHA